MAVNRIPSIRRLTKFCDTNRWAAVDAWQRDLLAEIDGLKDGSIIPWNGATRAGELDKTRRRLRRLRRNAAAAGIALDS